MAYRYQVNFEKVFTAGLLKGRRYPCAYLRFADWQSANDFATKFCDAKTVHHAATGEGEFIAECPILTALE